MKVLVISAHPDDEILGAGGTLLRHKNQGDEIYWLILTNIFSDQGFEKQRVINRQNEIVQVGEMLGVNNLCKLDFKTTNLSYEILPKLVSGIGGYIEKVNPEIIYTMNRSDAHSDHRIGFDAVMACTKSFRNPSIKEVLMYECISETEFAPALSENMFVPNVFIDISQFLEKKLEILNVYESEIGSHPFPRSVENVKALATFRGATAGVRYAEAFQLIKKII